MRRVPLPLALMIAVGVVMTMAWITYQPPWNGPDETGHFAYVQKMVEEREIPWFVNGQPEGSSIGTSSEVGTAVVQSGARARDGNRAMKDVSRAPDEQAWEDAEAELPSERKANTDFMATMLNPPGYPLYEALPYAATSKLDVFSRLYVLRLWNLPLIVAIIVSTWLFTGLVVGPRRVLQTLATGVATLNAQLISTAAAVNADALVAALYSVAFVLMALILLRGPTRRRWIALAALTVVAGFTHGRGLPLVLPVGLTAAITIWRATRPHGARSHAIAVLAALGAVAATALIVVRVATGTVTSVAQAREFGSYLWQFYLPRPGFMEPYRNSDWGARQVFIDRFWGMSPQLDTRLSDSLINLMSTLSLVGVLAFLVLLAVRWRVTARVRALFSVLLVAFVGYLLVLHVAGYRSIEAELGDPVVTGRYLIPFMVLFGAMVAVGVSWLPRRVVPVAASVLLFAALALSLSSLGAQVLRFHAS